MGQNYPALIPEKLTNVTLPADPSQNIPATTAYCIKFLTNNIYSSLQPVHFSPALVLILYKILLFN